MANQVQIYNLVGALVGAESHITDPNDDRTLARTIKAVWDLERKATIRDGEWNFAVRRAELPALAGVVPYPYGNAFQKPAGSLRILEILNSSYRDRFTVEGSVILANAGPPLYIRYLIDEPNSALWDDSFADAFAARLAYVIGERIAGSAYNRAEGWTWYQRMLAQAKATDARENPPLEQEESGWIAARWGYTGGGVRWS